MKIAAKICAALLAAAPFAGFCAPSQTVNAFKNVAALIKTGNIEQLVKQMEPQVELLLLNVDKTCNQEQAHALLTDFVQKNLIINFSMIHVGGKEERCFGIGLLSTESGKFRVTVFIRVDSKTGAYTIQQLKVENEN
ncbi:MAG: DUF4783 domain-containing protein [Prevotellaceae bacterium]|jgi:hypothetical protein|nr:DUF4783 domain-containing protein [Prevotellaceae bacterium]